MYDDGHMPWTMYDGAQGLYPTPPGSGDALEHLAYPVLPELAQPPTPLVSILASYRQC